MEMMYQTWKDRRALDTMHKIIPGAIDSAKLPINMHFVDFHQVGGRIRAREMLPDLVYSIIEQFVSRRNFMKMVNVGTILYIEKCCQHIWRSDVEFRRIRKQFLVFVTIGFLPRPPQIFCDIPHQLWYIFNGDTGRNLAAHKIYHVLPNAPDNAFHRNPQVYQSRFVG